MTPATTSTMPTVDVDTADFHAHRQPENGAGCEQDTLAPIRIPTSLVVFV